MIKGLYESEITNLYFLDSQKKLKALYLEFVDIQTISSVKAFLELEEFVAVSLDIKENSNMLLVSINPKKLSLRYCSFVDNVDFFKKYD